MSKPTAPRQDRRWWTLAALSVSLFMVMLDNTVVNVALPSIERDLHAGVSQLEWVVSGYVLTFAVFLLTGGKLADFLGRRRIFLTGLALFVLSSLACGLASTPAFLVSARAIQGIGAALMMPATLSIISVIFPREKRGAALGAWAGISAVALAVGPLVGGLVTEHVGWSWIFFVNVPIGIVGLVAGRLLVPESRDTSPGQRLDLPGLLSSGVALFALVFALIEAHRYGWGSATILGLCGLAAAALAVFLFLESRVRTPMLDLSLFRSSTFTGANVVALLVTLAIFGVFFFLSLYMQEVLRYSPVRAGATFLPMTVVVMVIAPVAGRLADRLGSRWLMSGGLALLAVALFLLSRLQVDSGLPQILPGLVIGGLGIAITQSPMTTAALGAVPVARSGVGSGVLNTFRQVGGALGIAAMGAILTTRLDTALAHGASRPQAFVDGLSRALIASAAVALLGALTAALTIRKGLDPEEAEARKVRARPEGRAFQALASAKERGR